MNPGDSKAMEGIQNVERVNGGEVEHDSGDEADEPNGGVSLEEVRACCRLFNWFRWSAFIRQANTNTIKR